MRATEKKPNRLIHETSPYLLQHAYNPVDWYPWGEEAFSRARAEDRPIFLSVGYSSCHWCHVMERESFEDEEIARILNGSFLPVKVDREERPDVDAIYMTAVQMLTQQGGWPMSVFLTPDLKPFFAGTYFPPVSGYGRPGFREILERIALLWSNQREKVLDVAGNVGRILRADEAPEGVETAGGTEPPGPEVFRAAFAHAERSFDSTHGGFGGAPKFPRPVDLSQLLLHFRSSGDRRALEMVRKTLREMADGGICDQIGGGFHRYSTDVRWLVPHFEKMLYDNALLARTYVEGWQATGDTFFARVSRETLDYLLREMVSPEGAFHSATDADSAGGEGAFFVWTYEEIEEALGKDRAGPFCFHYGVEPSGNFEGRNVLHRAHTVGETAMRFGKDPVVLEELFREGRRLLLDARERREKPSRDEKVIAAWNGLAISAFSRAHVALREPRYLEAAVRAAAFARSNLIRDGVLHRIWKDGRVRFPAYLDDHAYLVEGLIDLYEATFDPSHLDLARSLADRMIADFWDASEGGFFFTAPHHRDLIARRKDPFDGATPSGNGVAALDLLRLSALTDDASYRDLAGKLLASLKRAIESVPMGFASTLMALDFYTWPAVEVVLVGDSSAQEMKDMLAAVGRRFIPRRVLAGAPSTAGGDLARKIPILRDREAIGGRPTAYVCRDLACERPVTNPADLEASLEALKQA